jgi:molybdate transport system substrate-binding protein
VRTKTPKLVFLALALTLTLLAHITFAADIRVVSSGGFAAADRTLAPQFEQATGHHLITGWGPSMGNTADAVPQRLARHEPIDVLIMVGSALDKLVEEGKVIAYSRVVLARSAIGAAVRTGAPADISTVAALRNTLLNAKSIAYSDSASGVYISTELFQRLGITDQVSGKSRMIPAQPVGLVVARGEAEIGFQQISELKPIAGIQLLGPLPDEVQKITLFSAGIVIGSKEPDAAKTLLTFLSSPAATKAISDSGQEPYGMTNSRKPKGAASPSKSSSPSSSSSSSKSSVHHPQPTPSRPLAHSVIYHFASAACAALSEVVQRFHHKWLFRLDPFYA